MTVCKQVVLVDTIYDSVHMLEWLVLFRRKRNTVDVGMSVHKSCSDVKAQMVLWSGGCG